MHSRSEQLSIPQIPLQSFEWIWETPFLSWLSSSDTFFWISGKPGSGKSTLMQHLAKSGRALRVLNNGGRNYVILRFFFDYRAGSMEANSPIGVLKMFLSQLCARSVLLERKLAEENAETFIETAGVSYLLDLLAEASRLLGSELCAFVDGLDEYYGSYTDLGNILAQVQDRTGMKLCVASRSEQTFLDLFKGRPSIRMQDHNAASIRTYIDHAIRKGLENMAQVDMVFDRHMREQLQRRAQGVIIWARLAVDELLRAAYDDTPRETLEEILERLPEELEEMYERSITKMRHTNTIEVVLILFLLNKFGGSVQIGVLFGLWHFFCSRIPGCRVPSNSITQEAFLERLVALIGSLIDILTQSAEVRLMHKTLQPCLRRSPHMRDYLPQDFRGRYEYHFEFQIYADVIEAATIEPAATLDEVLARLKEGRQIVPDPTPPDTRDLHERLAHYCLRRIPNLLPAWRIRIDLLSWSMARFVRQARILEEDMGPSCYRLLERAMSSYLLIAAFQSWRWIFSNWHRAQRGRFIDLVIALHCGLTRYVKQRLTGELLLNERDWCELLCLTLSQHGAEGYLLDLLRPHCKVIQSDLLRTFVDISRASDLFQADVNGPLARILSEMKLPPLVRKDPLLCEIDSCGKGDDFIHWWVLRGRGDVLSKTILHHILESGESINTRCKQSGTALHILVKKCMEQHWGKYCPVSKFTLLARLGIDPAMKHNGQTPLQLATQLKRAAKVRSLLSFARKPSHVGDLDTVIRILTYYEKNGRWPEPIVSCQPQHALTLVDDALWQVEAGQIVLADPAEFDIDGCEYSFRNCRFDG